MVDGSCSKTFPKAFQLTIAVTEDSYPVYRRPEDGRTVTKGRHQLDNRWVVPYNPYLAQKYNAHINVDVCATIKSVEDIYKHGFKGHDRAPVQITAGVVAEQGEPQDEIKQYLDARYVGSIEACWRIFRFAMHKEWPNVVRLQVHLPNQQVC